MPVGRYLASSGTFILFRNEAQFLNRIVILTVGDSPQLSAGTLQFFPDTASQKGGNIADQPGNAREKALGIAIMSF